MRGAPVVTLQVVVATVGIALISGLIGFLVVHLAGWGDAVSGSPSENLVRGRSGAFGTYWGESAPLPQARSSS